MRVVDGGIFYKRESGWSEQVLVWRLRHEVNPFLEVVEGAVIVWDGVRVAGITELPIKASVDSSEFVKCEGVTGFERFVANDFGVSGFVVTVVSFGGSVSVGHLSG